MDSGRQQDDQRAMPFWNVGICIDAKKNVSDVVQTVAADDQKTKQAAKAAVYTAMRDCHLWSAAYAYAWYVLDGYVKQEYDFEHLLLPDADTSSTP